MVLLCMKSLEKKKNKKKQQNGIYYMGDLMFGDAGANHCLCTLPVQVEQALCDT